MLLIDPHSGTIAAFYEAMWASINQQGTWSEEIWSRRKDGTTNPEWSSITGIRDGAGEPINYLAVFTGITSMQEAQAQLVYLAHHDPLTGLPKHPMFMARLNHALDIAKRSKRQFTVLLLDLDGFK